MPHTTMTTLTAADCCAVFAGDALETAVRPGAGQYLHVSPEESGFDLPDAVRCFAVDAAADDWQSFLRTQPGFDPEIRSFCDLSGLFSTLSEPAQRALLTDLAALLPQGSTLVFDCPNDDDNRTPSPALEARLSDCGFLLYEVLTPQALTEQFFGAYNRLHPAQAVQAPAQTAYCLAVWHCR